MVLPDVLQSLGLILGAGLVGALVARLLKLPALVGYLFGGVVAGALSGGQLVGDQTIVGLADFGVAMLMFSLGVELSWDGLGKRTSLPALGALVQVGLTMAVTVLLVSVAGVSLEKGVFVGAAVSLSSTAVVIKLLEATGRLGSEVGNISVTWMLVQDLLVVPFFFFLPLVGERAVATGEILSDVGLVILKTGAIILTLWLVGRRVGRAYLTSLSTSDSPEVLLLGVIVWVLTLAAVSVWLGLTMTLGVFLAGVMLSGSIHETEVLTVTRPIRDLFAAIFFISLGLFLTPSFIIAHLWIIILGSVLLLCIKFTISLVVMLWLGYHARLSLEIAAPIAGVGEFAFLVAMLGYNQGIVDWQLLGIVIGVTLFSIALTPPFAWAVEKIGGRILEQGKAGEGEVISDRAGGESGFGDKTQVVICGFGRLGSWVGRALARENIPFTVIDYHHQRLKAAAELTPDVVYGDATNQGVLVKAGVARARVVVVTLTMKLEQETIIRLVRAINPNIVVIGRALKDEDVKYLKELGAQVVIQPEFEASLSVIHRLLHFLGRDKETVAVEIRSLREEFSR